MFLRVLSSALCSLVLAAPMLAQMDSQDTPNMPSPPATATVSLAGSNITIKYHTPHLRGRHLGGSEIVPWNQVWRTGANPATTLITPVPLHIGNLLVPAGTYTIYTLPTANKWMLIVNKQTGQWGTKYDKAQDLGRVKMTMTAPPAMLENLKYTLVDNGGGSGSLTLAWENKAGSVPIKAQ